MAKKKVKLPKESKCYAFLGVWRDGNAGWMGASHLGGCRRFPDYPATNNNPERKDRLDGERLFLCEITIKPITTKNGKPITRIFKNK